MKKVLLLLVVTMFAALPALSQGWWSVGVGVTGASPMGDFSNVANFGFGGLVSGNYHFDQSLSIGAKSGYISFGGKSIGSSSNSPSLHIIPITATAKYYFMPTGDTRFFGSLDLGMYSSSTSVTINNVDYSASSTDFGFSPAVGATFKAGDKMNVDASVNYTTISTSGSSTSWIGVTVGLDFGM